MGTGRVELRTTPDQTAVRLIKSYKEDGRSKTGQIKLANIWDRLFGLTYTVNGRDLDVLSLIRYLNAQVDPTQALDEGCCFGSGRSTNAEITAIVNQVLSIKPTPATPAPATPTTPLTPVSPPQSSPPPPNADDLFAMALRSLETDKSLAMRYFKEAADLGHEEAQIALATQESQNPSTGDDLFSIAESFQSVDNAVEAQRYYQQAADLGHLKAREKLTPRNPAPTRKVTIAVDDDVPAASPLPPSLQQKLEIGKKIIAGSINPDQETRRSVAAAYMEMAKSTLQLSPAIAYQHCLDAGKVTNGNCPQALFILGCLLGSGLGGVQKNVDMGRGLLNDAADMNYQPAMDLIAQDDPFSNCLQAINKSFEPAEEPFARLTKEAKQGSLEAQLELCKLILDEKVVFDNDEQELRRLAASGCREAFKKNFRTDAQAATTHCYNTYLVNPHEATALDYFTFGCLRGCGIGVDKDTDQGLGWLQLATDFQPAIDCLAKNDPFSDPHQMVQTIENCWQL